MPTFSSLRTLRKHWKLTAIAVCSLAIAMALGVVSLSLTDTFLLLRPAAPNPGRLVIIHGRSAAAAVDMISYPDYQYLREHNHVFTDIAADPNSVNINGDPHFGGREVKVISRPVTENYFSVLGIHAALGRLLAPGDERSKAPVAVMTYACWKRLGADPKIAGKVLAGNTIVGVLPESFTGGFYGLNGDLFVPLSDANYSPEWRTQRDARRLMLLARLKPGITRREAQAEVAALCGQLASAYPREDKGHSAVLTRATLLPPDAIPTAEMALGILTILVLLVLLIACANVANLLLAVAVGRRQEAAIKLALGARRGRLVREFMRESALLCVAGSALGGAVAWAVMGRFSRVDFDFGVLGTFSFGINLRLDAAVIGLTLILTAIAIVATGVAPALYASSPNLSQMLGGELVVGGTRRGIRRNLLVIAQVAICTLVLAGMGLCWRNLYNLRHVDPGFSARNLVGVQVYPAEHQTGPQIRATYRRLHEMVAALPGVDSVSLAAELPLSLGFWQVPVELPDHSRKARIPQNVVDSGYFTTFGIPLLEGRGFNTGDRDDTPRVVVINRKMAEMFWPGAQAVGKTVLAGDEGDHPPAPATVIGVTANGKYGDFAEPDSPVIYSALSQHPLAGFNIAARTKGDPRLWIEPLARVVRQAGMNSLFHPLTYEGWSNFTLLLERITAGVVEGLTVLALLLAVMGLAGAISYSVSERKKELGIRLALGAVPGRLMRMVLRQTSLMAGAGIAIGIVLGIVATALLRSRFFGIGVVEWTVLVPVAGVMLALSLAVAYLAALPWIAADPMEAVRHA